MSDVSITTTLDCRSRPYMRNIHLPARRALRFGNCNCSCNLDYGFSFSADGRDWRVLAENVDGVLLSPAVIEGYNYTGV